MTITPGTLYLVGTPIGNLGDLSPRALETLSKVDFIAAEDTRVTGALLAHHGIKKPLVSYYEHNLRQRGEQILARLKAGESCALCTDAGMPAISDPGCDIVRLCHEAGVPVAAVPGPSAVTTALALSGLDTGRFVFDGFLSTSRKSRFEHLAALKNEPRTIVLYEAPHKLRTTLDDLAAAFGPDRPVSLCRELTKLHEEIVRTTLGEAVAYYKENDPRGEYVLVVAGADPAAAAEAAPDKGDVVAAARALLAGGMPPSAAARQAAAGTPFSKGEIYKELIGKE